MPNHKHRLIVKKNRGEIKLHESLILKCYNLISRETYKSLFAKLINLIKQTINNMLELIGRITNRSASLKAEIASLKAEIEALKNAPAPVEDLTALTAAVVGLES